MAHANLKLIDALRITARKLEEGGNYERGDFVGEYGADESGVLVATFDLAECAKNRAAFGFFRDRRPELYGRLVEDR